MSIGMRLYTPHFKQPNNLIPVDTMAYIGLFNNDLSGIREVGLDLVGFSKLMDSDWKVFIRAGSSTGDIIALALIHELIEDDEGFIKIQIKPIDRVQDLFIVFTTSNYMKGENEFEIRSIKFFK